MRTAVPTDTLLTGASSKANIVLSTSGLPASFDLDASCTSSSQRMSPRVTRVSPCPAPLPCPADLRDMLAKAGGPPARSTSRDEAMKAAAAMRATCLQLAAPATAAFDAATPATAAREVASVLVPEVDKESVPSFIIAGQHKSIARKRATLALRGCFFAQWRAQRSAAIHGRQPRSRAKIRDALNKRLRAAILRDWIRCHGQHGFERRWRSYVEITDGTVSFVNPPPTS